MDTDKETNLGADVKYRAICAHGNGYVWRAPIRTDFNLAQEDADLHNETCQIATAYIVFEGEPGWS